MSRTGMPDELLDKIMDSKSITLKVKTNCRRTRIVGYDDGNGHFLMEVSARPENNEANTEIIKYLRKHTRKSARIILGLKSKEKIIAL